MIYRLTCKIKKIPWINCKMLKRGKKVRRKLKGRRGELTL